MSGGGSLKPSEEAFDWLGPGVYFWEGDPRRAREWAEEQVQRRKYSRPFVLGAAIDLGNCLDLTIRENLELLGAAYDSLRVAYEKAGKPLPENKDVARGGDGDKLLRYLDCAVIRHLHFSLEQHGEEPFDTVRGLFVEGEPIYPGSGFHAKSHTQIAVRSTDSIKGFFLPR